MRTTERRLLRPAEVGEQISFCESKVRALIRSGEIRAVRVQGVLRVPTEAVEDFIANLPETTAS